MPWDKAGWYVPEQAQAKEPNSSEALKPEATVKEDILDAQTIAELQDARKENLRIIERLNGLKAISSLNKLETLAIWRGLMPRTNVVLNFEHDISLGERRFKGETYDTGDLELGKMNPMEKQIQEERKRVQEAIDVIDDFGLASEVGGRFIDNSTARPFKLHSWETTDIHATVPIGGQQLLHVGFDKQEVEDLKNQSANLKEWHRPIPPEYKKSLAQFFLPLKPLNEKTYTVDELDRSRRAVEAVKVLDPEISAQVGQQMDQFGIKV